MSRTAALTLSLLALVVAPLGLVLQPALGTPATVEPLRFLGADRPRAEGTVFLGGRLTDVQTVALTTAIQASGHPGVVLFDSPDSARWTHHFFKSFQPAQVIAVGRFPEGVGDLELRYDRRAARSFPWEGGPPAELQRALFPQAPRVVVAPAAPRRLLLQSACLAGALRAPLFVSRGGPGEAERLRAWLDGWGTVEAVAVGKTVKLCHDLPGVRAVHLVNEKAVTAAYLREQAQSGPIRALVLANPADLHPGKGGMSALAPWVALQRRAALLLTNDAGTDAEAVVRAALDAPALREADALLIVASLQAIPTERRPNPVPGGRDPFIEMEPLTPRDGEPATLATGRLFHPDPNVVALMLARPRLLRRAPGERPKALLVSNTGGGLPLLETLSRTTAAEFRNVGYDTTPLFGRQARRDIVRRQLPEQTVFLWEGHHSTLVRDYRVHQWPEPLRPSLVFLQSCLALQEAEAHPFLERGAVGVIGSSTRTYSASGGAFALAFCNAFLYEGESLGGALRQAKNFLLAFTRLKEKRLGAEAKLGGANLRAAWAFTLWGDPTVKLPRPVPPKDARRPVGHAVRGNTIVVSLPDDRHSKVASGPYEAQVRPNARLAGLQVRGDNDVQQLVPLVFAEVHLPDAPAGKEPALRSRLPGSRWVFRWDARARRGYLLLAPRRTDAGELKFRVAWK